MGAVRLVDEHDDGLITVQRGRKRAAAIKDVTVRRLGVGVALLLLDHYEHDARPMLRE